MSSEKAPDDGRFVRTAADSRSKGATGFTFARAVRCAMSGIAYTFRSQRNLKIQLVFAVVAVVLGIVLHITQAEWLAIVLCIVVVTALETVNTAIESIVDLASPGWNELARRAKDAAAGAVYIAAFGSVVVAAIVYLPYLAALFA